MNCDETQKLLAAYSDGELDLTRTLEIEEHLEGCESCRKAVEGLSTLKKAIGEGAPYYKAPMELRQRVIASLPRSVPAEQTRHFWQMSGWGAGLAMAACLSIGLFLGALVYRPHQFRKEVVSELTSSHIRSLLATHLMDVVSTDQHTVKPWFDGKIDFAPPVQDLADHGFPLVGGRLDYIHGRTVAVLIYQARKHIINLFIWPSTGNEAEPSSPTSEQGYNLVNWRKGGMTFWAVSDLNTKELSEFSQAVESEASSGTSNR